MSIQCEATTLFRNWKDGSRKCRWPAEVVIKDHNFCWVHGSAIECHVRSLESVLEGKSVQE